MRSDMLNNTVRDGRTAVEYQIQPGEMMDGMVLKACKEGSIAGVLPMGASFENGCNFMYAYADDMDTFYNQMGGVATVEFILTSFASIVNTLLDLSNRGVDSRYIVLDTNYIFMAEGGVKLTCMPGKNADEIDEAIPDFFRWILANCVYDENEDGDYVAKLLSAINRGFTLESFLEVVNNLMEDEGIEVAVSEPMVAEPVMPEPMVAEPVMPEPMVAEPVMPEPVVAEPVMPEPVVAEPVMPEPMVVEPVMPEPVVAEPVMPEPMVAEPVMPEPMVAEPMVAEPVMPEPVVAEPVMPEPVVAEPVMPEPMVAEPMMTAPMGVVPEDDIEFEPIPDELNAKIERMNAAPEMPEPMQPQMAPMSEMPMQPQSGPQMGQAIDMSSGPRPLFMPEDIGMQPEPMQPQMAPVPEMPMQPQMAPMPEMQVQPQMAPMPEMQVQPQMAPVPEMPMQPQMAPMPEMPMQPQMAPVPEVPVQPQAAPQKPTPHLTRTKNGEYILLPDGDFVMGKSTNGVNYTVMDNNAVSRVHCTIFRSNGAYFVRDENSTNSTYVNGEKLVPGQPHLLINNCKLYLADEEFIYQLW